MKKLALLSFCLCICIMQMAGQQFHKAVVTDVNYMLRLSPYVDQQRFPFYFHFQEFIDDVLGDITKHIQEKFGIDTVIFFNPGTINVTEAFFAPGTKAKTLSRSGDREALYFAVETMLQLFVTKNDVPTYHFITSIKAFNGGKQVYKFSNRIPFTPVIEDDITGIIEMGEQDFYAFYFDGLQLAFEGQISKDQKRYTLKPPTPNYAEFLKHCLKHYVVAQRNAYLYGISMDTLQEAIAFSNKFFQGIDNELNLGNLFEGNKVKDTYYVINRLSSEDYIIKFIGGESTVLNIISIATGLEITIRDRNEKEWGRFDYSNGRLEGNFYDRHYRLIWNPEFRCTEFETDNVLTLLINDFGDQKVLFLDDATSPEEQSEILTLIFLYDFALQAQAEIDAN
jgi:hypothetical protein